LVNLLFLFFCVAAKQFGRLLNHTRAAFVPTQRGHLPFERAHPGQHIQIDHQILFVFIGCFRVVD